MNEQANSSPHSIGPTPESSRGAPPAALSDRVRSLRLPDRQTAMAGGGRRLPWIICGILGVLLAGAVGVIGFQMHGASLAAEEAKKAQDPDAAAAKNFGGGGSTAAVGEVTHESKGYIIAAHEIQVSPKVSGMIVDLRICDEQGRPLKDENEQDMLLMEGRHVKKGWVLAQLEDIDYKADHDRAVAALEMARQQLAELTRSHQKEIEQARAEADEAEAQRKQLHLDYQRSANLRTGTAMAAKEYEQAESQYRAMDHRVKRLRLALELMEKGPRLDKVRAKEAEIRQMQAEVVKVKWRLDNCKIRAPVAGTILRKLAEEGNIVNQLSFNLKGSLCDMADLSDLEVDLTIQERDVSRVFKGQKCRVRSEAYPDRVYEGVVSRLMPVGDRGKGAVPVRVKLSLPKDEEGMYLKPEMGAIVSFLKSDKK